MQGQGKKLGAGLMSAALVWTVMAGFGHYLNLGSQAATTPSALTIGKGKMAKGDYTNAVKTLEAVVKSEPTNCEAHFCLGQSYAKLKNFIKAREHFRTAIKVGKGSPGAIKANTALMTLPKNLIAPKTGPDTRFIAKSLGILSRERGADGEAKPTVMDFYASWCQPCKQLEPLIAKAKSDYGDKVNFMSINVDDPNNESLIEQYGVSPIPTLVFLSPEGEVVTYSIGYQGENGVSSGLKKILGPS
jgi:thioredoxin 1